MEGWAWNYRWKNPTDLTKRRWRNFAISGANASLWGCEAVSHKSRRPGQIPNQLLMNKAKFFKDFAGLFFNSIQESTSTTKIRKTTDDLLIGLQTHPIREDFAKPIARTKNGAEDSFTIIRF